MPDGGLTIDCDTVVAEKLETTVTRGMTNSRMKDYYDLLAIFLTYDLAMVNLAKAIAATFQRRQTALPDGVPPRLSDAFGADEVARRLWREFLRRLRINDVSIEFTDVIQLVPTRIWSVMVEARKAGTA